MINKSSVLCFLFSIILVLIPFLSFAQGNTENAVFLNRIAAIVNDQVITQTQLDNQVASIKKQMQQANIPVPNQRVLQRQVLDRMIDDAVQLQIAEKSNITISQAEMSNTIQNLAKQNNMSLQQFYSSVEASGLTIKEFRDQMRRQLTIQKLQAQQISPRVSISEQEVNDVLHSMHAKVMPDYHVANILVALPATPSPSQIDQAKQKADAIMLRLNKGEKFEKVAAEASSGTTALQGGDLGWRKLAELPTVFAKKVVTMQTGQIAGPIQTPNGFHIIKLLGIKNTPYSNTYSESELQVIVLKPTSKQSVSSLKARLNNIRNEIIRGESMNELAKKYSQEKKTAKLGGYVGWVNVSNYNDELVSTVAKLNPGKLSEPVETTHGIYLVKVIAKRDVDKSTAAEKQDAAQLVFKRKFAEELQTFVNQLRSQSYIKVFIE